MKAGTLFPDPARGGILVVRNRSGGTVGLQVARPVAGHLGPDEEVVVLTESGDADRRKDAVMRHPVLQLNEWVARSHFAAWCQNCAGWLACFRVRDAPQNPVRPRRRRTARPADQAGGSVERSAVLRRSRRARQGPARTAARPPRDCRLAVATARRPQQSRRSPGASPTLR